MDGLAREHPDLVRRVIAEAWLRTDDVPATLGTVTLRPHQIEAARRIRALLAQSGGALLCDEVGLGKTYVALAVARFHGRPLVVAPASLHDMWLAAAVRANVGIRFLSTESLSRRAVRPCDHDFLIVDEAHRFRTPSTARYGSLARLAARTPVLLVSATPLHNSAADMTALLTMFLGSAARILSPAKVAKHVVRRRQHEVESAFPHVYATVRIALPHDRSRLRLLLKLPPPTPARDGGAADAIIAHTLVRVWASSDAALRQGLCRRLAKAVAIRHALESGRYPTRRELAAWTYADGAVQFGFAQILAPTAQAEDADLLDTVRAHESALVALIASVPRESSLDAARVERLRALRRSHASAKIVAFSQFAATVEMYYRGLARGGSVAMLTSRGARIASGSITRGEALRRFAPTAAGAPRPQRREEITLLIATDLLSEGVNLQDASVVVHLDLPWTAATLEQRVGRVARLGSENPEVFAYAFEPPASSERILRAETIIRGKAELVETHLGASRIPPLFTRPTDLPRTDVEDDEAIRRALASWTAQQASIDESPAVCAAVTAASDGFLALVTVRGKPALLAGCGRTLSTGCRIVRNVIDSASGEPTPISALEVRTAVDHIRRWIDGELASDDAGKSSVGPAVLAGRLTTRLARYLAACPRHERTRFSARIAAVHARLQSPLTLGVEREIEDLLGPELRAQEFMNKLEQIIGPSDAAASDSAFSLRALLILRRQESPDNTHWEPSSECGSDGFGVGSRR